MIILYLGLDLEALYIIGCTFISVSFLCRCLSMFVHFFLLRSLECISRTYWAAHASWSLGVSSRGHLLQWFHASFVTCALSIFLAILHVSICVILSKVSSFFSLRPATATQELQYEHSKRQNVPCSTESKRL